MKIRFIMIKSYFSIDRPAKICGKYPYTCQLKPNYKLIRNSKSTKGFL